MDVLFILNQEILILQVKFGYIYILPEFPKSRILYLVLALLLKEC